MHSCTVACTLSFSGVCKLALLYVILLFSNKLAPWYQVSRIEALWIEVKLDKRQMLVCNVYRPPDAKAEWMDEMAVMIEHGVQVGSCDGRLEL